MTPADFLAARRAMGLTQRALAERLGVSARAVQHWEGGTRPIPGPVVRVLTDFMDKCIAKIKRCIPPIVTYEKAFYEWPMWRIIVRMPDQRKAALMIGFPDVLTDKGLARELAYLVKNLESRPEQTEIDDD